jgi:hypothetical protein
MVAFEEVVSSRHKVVHAMHPHPASNNAEVSLLVKGSVFATDSLVALQILAT